MDPEILDAPSEATQSAPTVPNESRNLPANDTTNLPEAPVTNQGAVAVAEAPKPAAPAAPAGPTPEQRAVQQYQAQLQQARQREQAIADGLFQMQIANLPQDQRQYAEAQRQLQQQAQQFQQRQAQFAQQQAAMEPVYKEIAVRDFLDEAKGFGVTREMLEGCETPDEMSRLTKHMERIHREQAAKGTSAKGAVAASNGKTARPNWLTTDSRTLLEQVF